MEITQVQNEIITGEKMGSRIKSGECTRIMFDIENTASTAPLFDPKYFGWRYDGQDHIEGLARDNLRGTHFIEELTRGDSEGVPSCTENYHSIGHCPFGTVGDILCIDGVNVEILESNVIEATAINDKWQWALRFAPTHKELATLAIAKQLEVGDQFIGNINRGVVEVIEIIAKLGGLRYKTLANGDTYSNSIEHFLRYHSPWTPDASKMYDVFMDVFLNGLEDQTVARILATDIDDARQMALEWDTAISPEDIAEQLANDKTEVWDSTHGIAYHITGIVELRELPIQILRSLGANKQLKPIYVPANEQSALHINAHYYK